MGLGIPCTGALGIPSVRGRTLHLPLLHLRHQLPRRPWTRPPPRHLPLLKRILRYIKGTLLSGLHISVGPSQTLAAYSDAD